MFKRFINYPIFVILFLSLITLLLFGGILRHHYLGGEKFPSIQKVALFFAEVPALFIKMIKQKNININKPEKLTKHVNKKRLTGFVPNKRAGLLILPRYNHYINRSVVDIVDLSNFEIIHTYKHDVTELNYKIVKQNPKFKNVEIDNSLIRFQYKNPILFKNGSLIVNSDYAPLIKLDLCSNVLWINTEEEFHHSKELDHQGNIWQPVTLSNYSKFVDKHFRGEDFWDDAIVKYNKNGKILYKKSVMEILFENKIVDDNFMRIGNGDRDPIHLNDIEPANFKSNFWEQGDLFLSSRHLSSIIHYRPSNNTVINYIKGPFSQQHDVDIISKNEIIIFNNNNFLIDNEFSEIVKYNFDTKEFHTLYNQELENLNFKTYSQGLSHTLIDGSIILEEQNHGRLILLNSKGELEWEFINKDKNGDVGFIDWTRVIQDEDFIKEFRLTLEKKKCID